MQHTLTAIRGATKIWIGDGLNLTITIPGKTAGADPCEDHLDVIVNRCRLPRCQKLLPSTKEFCNGLERSEFHNKFKILGGEVMKNARVCRCGCELHFPANETSRKIYINRRHKEAAKALRKKYRLAGVALVS